MSRIAGLFESQSEAVLELWCAAAVRRVRPGASTRSEMAAELPVLLQGLVAALRRFPIGAWEGAVNALAPSERPFGRDLSTQVHEYGLLREVLLDVACDQGAAASVEDVRCICDFMARAVEDGIQAHLLHTTAAERRRPSHGTDPGARALQQPAANAPALGLPAGLTQQNLLEALAAHPFLQVSLLEGPQYIFRMANPAYHLEVARNREIVGRPAFEALPEYAGQGFEALLEQVLTTGKPAVGEEMRAVIDEGGGVVKERYYTFVYEPVRGTDGHPISILSISADVTEVVHSRQDLERQASELEARAQFERQLIGIVSHDLKSPLSALSLRSRLLAEEPCLSDAARDSVLRIQGTTLHMVRLVNDLLDFNSARFRAGLPIVPEPMDLHAVLSEVVDEVQLSFPDRTIALDRVGSGEGIWDPARIKQVAANLISNAAKYSPLHATVRVVTRSEPEQVVLQVFNPGVPIDPESLPHLFEPLHRGATSPPDPTGRSVGLGLFIVKHIVDAHGGTIAVSSTVAAGTTFTVTLPRHALLASALS